MKPILFNTQMVKAILDGKKTVTRRCVKLPSFVKQQENGLYTLYADGTCYENQHLEDMQMYLKQPYKVDDVLYVRETWCDPTPDQSGYPILYKADMPMHYDEDGITLKAKDYKWKPSIHMPKEAARIFLRVTNVRVERLQDIMKDAPGPNNQVVREGCTYGCNFIAVWESTIKEQEKDTYGWDANPWVWVIEFERCSEPL